MDKELQKALDALGLSLKDATEAQQKAHKEFMDTVNADAAKRDAAWDAKIAKLQAELDKFEPVSKALNDIQEREKAEKEEREEQAKAMQEQLDRIETKANRPNAPSEDDVKAAAQRAAFFEFMRVGNTRMAPDRLNVMKISDDTGGGYLSPPDYLMEIIKAIVEFSPMRTLARVTQTSAHSVQIPRRTGTFTALWVGEIETRSETEGLAYGLHDVPNHELVADVRFSMANLEDSAFDLESEVRMEFAEQFGVAEGTAFVSGNSVKKPEGFLNATGTVSVNSGAASDITADGILDLKYGIKTAYARNATFVLNRNTLGKVRKLKDGSGQYLWQPGLADGRPNSVDGDPYAEFPDMPSVSAGTKSIAYGDWRRGYRIVDRLQLSVIRDGLTLASSGQVKFIARRRVGGIVTLAEAIGIMTVAA